MTTPSQPPPLPQAPTNFFGCDVIIEDLLGLAERFASITLVGAGGIGKTAIALTLLHHARITTRFCDNRHFMRCDDPVNSLDGFLGRLSTAIGVPHLENMEQLRTHLSSSPPCILVLDGLESILDPLASGATEITAAIKDLGRCKNVCLLATSRMDVKIPGFRRIEVPTLSADDAQDIFYNCCHLGRSPAVDNLLAELDFHPLSIDLLAGAVRENDWNEAMLLEAWNDGKTNILEANGRQSLEDNIRSILGTPTIQDLGMTVLETLEAMAAFPDGVKESKLENMFTGIAGVGEAADALCKFSLIYRQDGFVKMLSPFRIYFSESVRALVTPHHTANSGLSFPFHNLCSSDRTVVEVHLIDVNTEPPKGQLPDVPTDIGLCSLSYSLVRLC